MVAFCDDVRGYLYDYCVSHNWYVRRMGFDGNHVRILLQYNPIDSISHTVSVLKQRSMWYTWQEYDDFLRQFYWKERILWSDGYFAASVETASQEEIERYIENQG